ncbi:MAG: ribose-5-phosphate isomerase [Parcubacteria group bacterium]|nr:ribose-5-phosphate isomerase [Parcubacteria group bacterium]
MSRNMKKEKIGKIYIGADHAGFTLKEKIKKWLEKEGFPVVDKGNKKMVMTDDYPDFGSRVGKAVSNGNHKGTWLQQDKGLLFCGSSEGVCIVANKYRSVRAVTPTTVSETIKTREHNNSNVLCLSGWKQTPDKAKKLILAWLDSGFGGTKRHERRVNKIAKIEDETMKK